MLAYVQVFGISLGDIVGLLTVIRNTYWLFCVLDFGAGNELRTRNFCCYAGDRAVL